ncbi:MAG: GNAT family N-acetyltransferase [Calditrichaeota bacterium]|nr:GNAT family N-acetyltransferase [Calditrichota bacterium]RQW06226.1 MAG: GNAT family N-acetyltransferase [Calditrichota bacterium]
MKKSVDFIIRAAEKSDIPQLLDLVKKLADYEKLLSQVTASEELYRKNGFGESQFFRAFLVENSHENEPRYLGFALYFFTFSTFLGKPTLYLEDLFVLPEYRGRGIGTALLKILAKTALENNCGRMEWSVLDWNESAIRLYRRLGAVPMADWTVYRLLPPDIRKLAENK